MRRKSKEDEQRWFALAALIWAVFTVLLFTGCATVAHDPLYDGGESPSVDEGDTTTLVPIHIENHRVRDAVDPHFYLRGTGLHSLGIVKGMNGKLDRFIDTRWFGPDGCMTIIAHYVGGTDLVFERFCWRAHYRVTVTLDDIFNPVAAWAHP